MDTVSQMGELAREEQLDQQILKSLMEDLRKEDEHGATSIPHPSTIAAMPHYSCLSIYCMCAEAWVESVQAYGKLSRALASSPRGSAEAFHYATLKEKMDDQAYGTTHTTYTHTKAQRLDRWTYFPLRFVLRP